MTNVIRLVPPSEKKKPSRPRNTQPDGRKRIRVEIGVDPATGKRIQKSFYGATLKECREKRDAWLEQRKAGPLDVPSPNQKVSEWAEKWLEIYGSSAGYSQNQTVEIDVRRLCVALGNLTLQEVQQVHIQSYAMGVENLSKSAVSKIKQTTNRIFEAAFFNGLIPRNPCNGVVWKNAGAGTHRFLEEWEIRTITENYSVHHAGLWAMLMLYAGLRRGEALALQWEDIDFDANIIHVRHGVHFEINKPVLGLPKTANAIRDVPIFQPLSEALQAAPRLSPFVCTGASGQPVTMSIWASGWKAWNNAMGNIVNGDTSAPVCPGRRSDKDKPDRIKFNVRAHDLRHTFASMLYDADVDIKTAQKLLGHASADVTMQVYTHLSAMRETASIDKMTDHLKNMRLKRGSDDQKPQ